MPVDAAAVSDRGLVRTVNEDAFVARSDAGLWAVADGMGGHHGGAWASAVIAHAMDAVAVGDDFEADSMRVTDAIRETNAAIYREAEARQSRIGSTVVALLLRDDRFTVQWVGDSRAYRLRDGRLDQLSRDHTQVQDRVDRGLLTAQEARRHPMSHVLTRGVGVNPELQPDQASGDVRPGDRFLLCSDGLHGVVADEEIAVALAGDDMDLCCKDLLALVHRRGAPDNVTLVAIACAAAIG